MPQRRRPSGSRPTPRPSPLAREDQRPVVRATSPADIVAAVPYQCGFVPTRSLVVVSLRGPRRRIGLVTRLDLPSRGDFAAAAEQLAGMVSRDEARACVVLAYDEAPFVGAARPHAELVAEVMAGLHAAGVPVLDALYVTPERYWSYTCSDPRCCPDGGHLVSATRASAVAAAYVMAGLAPLPSRDALVERLQPVADLVDEVSPALWRWLDVQAAELDRAAGVDPAAADRHRRRWTGRTFELVEQLVRRYHAGNAPLAAEEAGQVLAGLHDREIRDAVLVAFCRYGLPVPPEAEQHLDVGVAVDLSIGRNVGAAAAEGPPDLAMEDAVEQLLVDLCVRADGGLACAPLTMLAWHSWSRGSGALARVAVDRALRLDPAYRLADLLQQALDHGMAPDWVAAARRSDEQAG